MSLGKRKSGPTPASSRRLGEVDELAWPVLSQHALDLLRSSGELHPAPGELLWDAGDPTDLHLVLTGGVLLVDRRDDRVVFVIEAGDFVRFAQNCLESEESIRPRDARTAFERQLIVEYEIPGGPFYEVRTEINRQLEEMARTARTSINDSHSAVDHL